MTTKFDRILFDYDGTLILHDKETEGKGIADWLDIPSELVPVFDKRLTYYFESSCGRVYYKDRKISKELGLYILDQMINPKEFGITAKQLYEAINERSKIGSKTEPTAIETLEYLSDKGYQLCIFTNGYIKPQIENMKYHGLYDYFERIYGWDGYYAKPDKRAFKRALSGTDPSKNVMIGDSLNNDIRPAKSLGIFTVGINISDDNKTKILPDVTINILSELKMFL